MMHDYPILEYDPSREALIEPNTLLATEGTRAGASEAISEHCVLCFFQDEILKLIARGLARPIHNLRSEMGDHPVHEMQYHGRRLTLFHPGVGAPLAAALLEELIAIGGRRFIACGGAGVLDSSVACGHLIVPFSAVRDEGTSYHYLPPAREVAADPTGVAAIEAALSARGCAYRLGKTWTTDAFYRETRNKIARRRAEGCVTVEMEAAALFAVAQFRGVPFGQLLYGGDDCGSETWDHRGWHQEASVREMMIDLAAEACLRL